MRDRDQDSHSFGTDMSSRSGVNSYFDDTAEWSTSRKDSSSRDFNDTFEASSFSEQYNGYSNQTEDHDAGLGGNVTKNNEGRAASSNLVLRQPIVEQSIGQLCGWLGLSSFAQGMVIGSAFSMVSIAFSNVGVIQRTRLSDLRSAAADGVTFAVWLTSYRCSKCYLRKTRGVDDIYNSFFAGNVAGMVGALKGRRPLQIFFSGLVSGVTMASLDAFQNRISF